MLERGRRLRHDVIAAQARRVAAADDGAVRCTHERHGQRAQRREAREGAPQRGRGRSERRAPRVRVRVAARREVRAGTPQHNRAHRGAARGKLLSREREVLPQLDRPSVRTLRVVQLDDGHAVRLVHPHAHQARPRSARRARPERAHHHKRAVHSGGRQLSVAARQEVGR